MQRKTPLPVLAHLCDGRAGPKCTPAPAIIGEAIHSGQAGRFSAARRGKRRSPVPDPSSALQAEFAISGRIGRIPATINRRRAPFGAFRVCGHPRIGLARLLRVPAARRAGPADRLPPSPSRAMPASPRIRRMASAPACRFGQHLIASGEGVKWREMYNRVEERKMVGWVTERHRCTLRMAFDQLHDVVKADVEEANGLLTPERQDRFPIEFNYNPGRFDAHGHPIADQGGGPQIGVIFTLHADRITIVTWSELGKELRSEQILHQRWDTKSASCQLYLDEKSATISQISQIALEPLFFGLEHSR